MGYQRRFVLIVSWVLLMCAVKARPVGALEVHADYRFAYGQCWTWGNGSYATAQAYLRLKEGWDTAHSNYPVDWQATVECRYMGMPAPMPRPGEYVVPGQMCAPKTVVPRVCSGGANDAMRCHVAADCPAGMCVPGSMIATSWPLAYIWVSVDYNGGGQSFPSGCIWDAWAYGAPPASTTTTMPTTLMTVTTTTMMAAP